MFAKQFSKNILRNQLLIFFYYVTCSKDYVTRDQIMLPDVMTLNFVFFIIVALSFIFQILNNKLLIYKNYTE